MYVLIYSNAAWTHWPVGAIGNNHGQIAFRSMPGSELPVGCRMAQEWNKNMVYFIDISGSD